MHPSSVGHDWPCGKYLYAVNRPRPQHVGSLHAADAQMAIENARDVYTRRQEGVSIWAVESKYIHAAILTKPDSLYDPQTT
jgi:ring-1,2-phenylacetyl-CoA epoxidase subunit PaaB